MCGEPLVNCRCKKTTPRAADGIVRVALERKGRGGKAVSVITGLTLAEDDMRALAADLKRHCGSGGTLKNGVIEIQGDHRDTLVEALKRRGMTVKKAGG